MNIVLIMIIEKHFGLKAKEIFSTSQKHEIVLARYAYFYIVRNENMTSYPKLGSVFNKDHATAMHGYKTFETLLKQKAIVKEIDIDVTYTNIINKYNVINKAYEQTL